MKNISSFNDFTDKDLVNFRWQEIKQKAHERHMNKVVKHLVKLSFKDMAFIMSFIAFIASGIFTIYTIITI